jgi:hypothetical protein
MLPCMCICVGVCVSVYQERARRQFISATAIASLVSCFLMGVLANMPLAVAPGMGVNAFFVYTVVGFFGTGGLVRARQRACRRTHAESAFRLNTCSHTCTLGTDCIADAHSSFAPQHSNCFRPLPSWGCVHLYDSLPYTPLPHKAARHMYPLPHVVPPCS